jgi:hypothetical protein
MSGSPAGITQESRATVDDVETMCPLKYWLPALVVLLLGCSSKGSASGGDGSASEAGKSEADTATDGPSRDVGVPGVDGGQGQDAHDVATGIDAAHDLAAIKDSKVERSGAIDGFQGGEVEGSPLDAAAEAGLVGLGTCESPIDIPPGRPHLDVPVNTTAAVNILASPCGNNGKDVILRVQVLSQQPQLFYADTFGATWNTMLLFSDTCDKAKPPAGVDTVVCNDDACGTSQSQVAAVLSYGYHYLILSGAQGMSGDATIHVQSAVLGNGPIAVLPIGAGSVKGTTSGNDRSGLCDTSGAKNSYWWQSCPGDPAGTFTASTCGGARWDTALSLQIPRADAVSCNDDDNNCGMQSTITAAIPPGGGIQVLTVGGSVGTSVGDYTLTYTRP